MVSTLMKISVCVLVVMFLALVFTPNTEAREFGDIYRECGLGAMLFPDTPVGAVISNIIWDLGTTAISSDITSPDSCAGGDASTAAFIHDAYDSIEKDLARGSGEYLDTLMSMSGYSEERYQSLALALRENFSKTVAVEGYTEQTRYQKAENLYNLFYKHLDGHSL